MPGSLSIPKAEPEAKGLGAGGWFVDIFQGPGRMRAFREGGKPGWNVLWWYGCWGPVLLTRKAIWRPGRGSPIVFPPAAWPQGPVGLTSAPAENPRAMWKWWRQGWGQGLREIQGQQKKSSGQAHGEKQVVWRGQKPRCVVWMSFSWLLTIPAQGELSSQGSAPHLAPYMPSSLVSGPPAPAHVCQWGWPLSADLCCRGQKWSLPGPLGFPGRKASTHPFRLSRPFFIPPRSRHRL